jgi:DnaJ-class molecular chaperone
MDYYATLGLKRGASPDDIKKAYRSMAMKHHPDRGGDEKTFKQVEEAYRFLSDPEKKRVVDMGGDPNAQPGMGGGFYNQGPFEFHFGGAPDMEDIFANFGFGRRPMRKNKTLNIVVDITLEDVLSGKEINAEITLPGTGKKKIINISIPPGIENGQQIRYEGMGDNAVADVRPGDLIVNIRIAPHPIFHREGTNLVIEKRISVWDAMLGGSVGIETLDRKTLSITIPAGTQPETVLSCKNEGLPGLRNRVRGNLLIKIKVEIPRNLNLSQTEQLHNVRKDFNE